MHKRTERLLGMRINTGILAMAATVGLGVTWERAAGNILSFPNLDLALALAGALVLCYRFPVHLMSRSKIYVNSVVLLLIAALLSPALAGAAAAVGMASGELMARRRTHNPGTIITGQVARTVAIVIGASLLIHLGNESAGLVALGAAFMWTAEILTFPLLYCPLTGNRPVSVMQTMVREGGLAEAGQYLAAAIGALVGIAAPMLLLVLVLPTLVIYFGLRRGVAPLRPSTLLRIITTPRMYVTATKAGYTEPVHQIAA